MQIDINIKCINSNAVATIYGIQFNGSRMGAIKTIDMYSRVKFVLTSDN